MKKETKVVIGSACVVAVAVVGGTVGYFLGKQNGFLTVKAVRTLMARCDAGQPADAILTITDTDTGLLYQILMKCESIRN